MSRAINDLTKILGRLSKTVQSAIDRVAMQAVGDFATNLIVKRTRLGYGVNQQYGPKGKFLSLSPLYVLARSKQSRLDSTTRPNKSNLTNTGQMLRSMQAKYKSKGVMIIEPTGTRSDSKLSNLQVAEFASDDPGKRPFNRLSALEFQQVLRFYRKTFGDLIKKSSKGSLIR